MSGAASMTDRFKINVYRACGSVHEAMEYHSVILLDGTPWLYGSFSETEEGARQKAQEFVDAEAEKDRRRAKFGPVSKKRRARDRRSPQAAEGEGGENG